MKKLNLFLISIGLTLSSWGQSMHQGVEVWMPSPNTEADQILQMAKTGNSASIASKNDKGLGERVLGETTYDLQTNRSVHDRIAWNSSGEISVVWTASEGNNPFNDRGTGYSYYDPGTDTWTQDASYPRIESERCGWPSILYDGNGGEIIISHSTISNTLKINTRSSIGSGTWSEKSISNQERWWARAAMGGNDGNTIHLIAASNPDADSTKTQLMSSALLYYRSQDAGQTWDIQDSILPGLDSSAMGISSAISSDSYSIIADGNHVAFAVFNTFNDVVLMESTDNGNTWTKTIVYDFPFKGYQDFKAKMSDTAYVVSCDGTGSIIFDDNGIVHMSYNRVYTTNDLTSGGYRYLSWSLELDTTVHFRNSSPKYWGSSAHYQNDDSLLNFTKFAFYGAKQITGYTNLAFGNDSLYMVYAGVSDSISSGIDPAVNMRQIYLIKSGDDGETWTDPLQLTITNPQFSENMFPDIMGEVDDKIRLVFHRDAYPSNYVTSINYTPNATQYTQTTTSNNEVIYLEIDLGGGGIGIGIEEKLNDISDLGIYPNPSHGLISMNVNIYREMNVGVHVTNMYGQVVHTYKGQPLTKGSNQLQMDLSHLDPGMYMVNIFGGGSKMNKKIVIN